MATLSGRLLRQTTVPSQRALLRCSQVSASPSVRTALAGPSSMQTRNINFAPGDWIRNAIRNRTQVRKPESAVERQEARKEAVAKGEASLFDTVQEEVKETASPVVEDGVIKPSKLYTEHKYSTGSFKISPRKLNLLSRQIAGKPVDQAILQMQFSDKRAAGRIKSMLCLARDHALVKGIRRERMVVSESWVNKIDALPRVDIKGRSRHGVKHHRYSRMHVVLKEGETREELLSKQRAKALKRAVSAGVVREDVPLRNPRPQWAW